MTPATTAPASPESEVAFLKDLLDQARQILKLDLALLVTAGAFFAALNISEKSMIDLRVDAHLIGIIYSALLVLDAGIYTSLMDCYAKVSSGRPIKPSLLAHTRILNTLVIAHALLIAMLIGGALGRFHGAGSARDRYEVSALLQEAIDEFVARTGKPPAALFHLRPSKKYELALTILDGAPIQFHAVPSTGSYTLTISGRDREIGTADDLLLTERDPPQRPILERVDEVLSKPFVQK